MRFEAGSDASREQLWELLARPERWREWAPHVRGASGLGSPEVTEGKRGRVSLLGLELVPATVLRVDPGRSWSWRVGPLELRHAAEAPSPGSGSASIAVVELRGHGLAGRALALAYAPGVWTLTRNLARVAGRRAG